jgi:hypothetical protein
MQRIAQSVPVPSRSNRPLRRRGGSGAAGSRGTVIPTGVEMLAPAFSLTLPVLHGAPAVYSHEFRAELLYELCAVLVREGLAGPEIWRNSEESAVLFAQRAIMQSVGETCWNLLQRNVEYHLTISDVADQDGGEKLLGNGQLAVTIECGGSGFLKLGPAIEALESESQGLGAAFYWTLTYALYRVMRVYNHDDAFQYEERMKEYAEDDPENQEQYEFPEVEKALPECIRLTLKSGYYSRSQDSRRLLSGHGSDRYRHWIERLRKIDRLSRLHLPNDVCFREEGGYDMIPLPSLLIAFKEHDAIVACFDEESQYMLEGTSEPTLGIVFSPQKADEVRKAIRTVTRFIAFNHEIFELAEELVEWEKKNADSRLHRGEPSLRAA